MPQAKKPTSATRSRSSSSRSSSSRSTSGRSTSARSAAGRARAAFKEPAALKRLNKSLEAAQKALAELRAQGGRDLSQGARSLHKDLGSFVSSARGHTGKLGKALQSDFEQAQKAVAKTTGSTRRTSTARKRAGATKARATTARKTAASATRRRTSKAK
jgi:hypothetical protein